MCTTTAINPAFTAEQKCQREAAVITCDTRSCLISARLQTPLMFQKATLARGQSLNLEPFNSKSLAKDEEAS